MKLLQEAIKASAVQIADHMDKQVEYIKECARINRGIAAGLYDVYTVQWPKHPGYTWPTEPVVWINPDGSSTPNIAWRPHNVKLQMLET